MIKLKKTATLALLTALLASPSLAYADDLDNKIKEQDQKIESLQEDQKEAEGQLAQIQANVDQIEQEINDLLADKAKEEERLNELNEEIEELKIVIAKRDEQLKQQAVDVQTNQSADNFLEAILTADSLNEAVGRALAVSTIVGANNDILKEQQKDKEKLEELLAETEERLQVIEDKSAELQVKQQELVEAQLDQEVLINELQSSVATEKKQKEKFVKQKEEAERKRQEQLKALEEQRKQEEEARKAIQEQATVSSVKSASSSSASSSSSAGSSASVSVNTQAAAPSVNSSGWMSPVSNVSVSSPYGPRANPTGAGSEFHKGIDLVGSTGTPIFAAKAGTVVQTGFDTGGGNYIIVSHDDGYYSHYLHLSSIGVSNGQSVSQGQTIGGMGTTGRSTGTHLDFRVGTGIWSGFVDPTSFVM
ncbi:peptidoglycan DD-metalloendopeptidase family protein [Enterococcus olivae]